MNFFEVIYDGENMSYLDYNQSKDLYNICNLGF